MPNHRPYRLIDTPSALVEICDHLKQETLLAVDTEFVRESTYYPRFCLMQIATIDATYCIDALDTSSLGPLQDLLGQTHITFVLHAARQDLELILHCFNALPSRILDSQIAAGLAGYHEQIGYACLIETLTGVKLSKEQTRTDWSQRPLTPEQLGYAANDVTYLIQAHQLLEAQLNALDRRHWWEADSNDLLAPDLYEISDKDAWKKVKGLFDLAPDAMARALIIAEWREETAKAFDTPRSWVMRDEDLLEWAEQYPNTRHGFRMRGIAGGQQRDLIEKLHHLLTGEPPIELATALSAGAKAKIDPVRKAMLKRLSTLTQGHADRLGLSASILATRKDLESLLDHPDRCRLLKGWRSRLIGEELAQLAHTELKG